MPQVAQGVSYVAPIYSATGNMLDVWASKSPTFARGLAQTGFKTGLQGVGVLGFTINAVAIYSDAQSGLTLSHCIDAAIAVIGVSAPYGWTVAIGYGVLKDSAIQTMQSMQQQIEHVNQEMKNPLFWLPAY